MFSRLAFTLVGFFLGGKSRRGGKITVAAGEEIVTAPAPLPPKLTPEEAVVMFFVVADAKNRAAIAAAPSFPAALPEANVCVILCML